MKKLYHWIWYKYHSWREIYWRLSLSNRAEDKTEYHISRENYHSTFIF